MSITIDPEATVATLVLEQPGRARVFERFAIDYCCGGKVPLRAACEERGLDVGLVLDALAESPRAETDWAETDWAAASLEALCTHIVDHHHAYLREELPPLAALTEKVARAHGDRHPELDNVAAIFAVLRAELESHMEKEEQLLFPACVALERRTETGLPFSVDAPIAAMVHEHDEVGAALERLRDLTGGYSPPGDACNSYRAMLDRLESLERDTHEHVHEENNILFPRAAALERAA
jgi:regulator of cell morphogenesis and NO signaling